MTKDKWEKSIHESPAVTLTGEYLVWAIAVCRWRKEEIREHMLTCPPDHLQFWAGEIDAIWNVQFKLEELLGLEHS